MTERSTSRPALQIVGGRPHDLPPSWDGLPVKWGDWSDARTTMQYHAPADELACEQCGTVDEPRVALGTRPPESGATITVQQLRTTRSGREYVRPAEVPAWPVKDLSAHRCRHCGHDRVHDQRTGDWWDLDADDYTDSGSVPADVLF